MTSEFVIKLNQKSFSPQRVFCIGRNYVKHIIELHNQIPDEPVIFLKPPSCLVAPGDPIIFPAHGADLQHEVEIVLLIGRSGRPKDADDSLSYLAGLALGLDLTLRDVQNQLKAKSYPWEKAKAFDDSAPIGEFKAYSPEIDLTQLTFHCLVNDEERQSGSSAHMIFPIREIIYRIGQIWALREGDLIYTGTPEGVGPLRPNDVITIKGELFGEFSWQVK